MSKDQGYKSFGIEKGVEILRYQHSDGSLSGILFKYNGGLLTARHVAEAHNLQGFKSERGDHFDIAYRLDEKCRGLDLGYSDRFSLENVDMVTSSIDNPDELVVISGKTGMHFLPTFIRPFYPNDPETASKYIKPGASGSPLVYKGHIVGLVPFQNLNNLYEAEALVFNGAAMKKDIEEFGLSLKDVN